MEMLIKNILKAFLLLVFIWIHYFGTDILSVSANQNKLDNHGDVDLQYLFVWMIFEGHKRMFIKQCKWIQPMFYYEKDDHMQHFQDCGEINITIPLIT